MSKYRQHPFVRDAKINARIDAGCDLLLAVAIGIGLAVLLVAWWSS